MFINEKENAMLRLGQIGLSLYLQKRVKTQLKSDQN